MLATDSSGRRPLNLTSVCSDSRRNGSVLLFLMRRQPHPRGSWRRKRHFVADKSCPATKQTAFNAQPLALQTVFVNQADIRHNARPATNLTFDHASSIADKTHLFHTSPPSWIYSTSSLSAAI